MHRETTAIITTTETITRTGRIFLQIHMFRSIDGRMPQIILGLWGFYVLGMQDALVTKSLTVE